MKQLALAAALLALTASSTPGAADAAGFDQFIVFGDSTLDTGYFRYLPSGNQAFDQAMPGAIRQGATGGYAGDGVMNTTMLAQRFGLSIAPIDIPTGGGTNYANGGATTVPYDKWCFPNNICTIWQIENYLHSVNGVANPNALYLIKTGDNDATYVTNQGQAWIDAHPTFLRDVAAELAPEVARLQAAGARTIMVRNSYDSALFAALGGDIADANKAAYARSKSLWTYEWSYLTAAGVHFIPADNDSLFSYVAHNPYRFGFTPQTVLSANAPSPVTAALAILSPQQQQEYLFIDGVHLTTAGQAIEADNEYNLLVAPGQISLLAESVVQGGWARAVTIQGQLDMEAQRCSCRPAGANFWTSAGGYNMKLTNAPGFAGDSGAPYGATVGVDYQTAGGLTVGAAFASTTQRQEFSTGGHYDQIDVAPSLYLAKRFGWVWGNAVATVDAFQDEVARSVPLGIFIDQNHGRTTGQSLALALRGGGDLGVGQWVITGPVGGLVMQRVCVGDFSETGTTGVTALSFAGQTRDSCVSQLGWRMLLPLGAFQPFAEMNWNHEFSGTGRTITTSLTSVSAPSYTMDAFPFAVDWATLCLGAGYQLNERVMLRGAVSGMFANPQMTSCGGDLGLNIAF